MVSMTQTGSDATAANPADTPAFPPDSIEAFLRVCAGEWMSLRSRFELDTPDDAGEGDEWHSSERGELVVAYLEPASEHRWRRICARHPC